ncbi:hypothetical protein AMTRI_Chr12g242020 [Amborella trichopoda]
MKTEKGLEEGRTLPEPEITQPLVSSSTRSDEENRKKGSIVLLSTFVAVCGSFKFGCALGFSSPTQSAIRSDLALSLSEVPVYIAEITPKTLRGGLTTVSQVMLSFGLFVVYVLGTCLTWHTLTLTESPRWLRLRGKDADISEEAAEIEVGAGLNLLQQFGGLNGISFYATQTFVNAGVSGTVGTIAKGSIQVSMSIVDALLMDKWGWRQLLMVSATGTCIGCLLTSISFILKDYESLQNWSPILALSGILVYTALVELGMAGIPWIIMAEIFPINVKGTAGSLVTLVHWFCSWIITFNYIFFMSWNKAGLFFIFTGFSGATVLFVKKLVPETKGRTLKK